MVQDAEELGLDCRGIESGTGTAGRDGQAARRWCGHGLATVARLRSHVQFGDDVVEQSSERAVPVGGCGSHDQVARSRVDEGLQ